jgi:hypothetical protein
LIGGWVGPRVGLDVVKKIKIFHCRAFPPVAIPTELKRIILKWGFRIRLFLSAISQEQIEWAQKFF